MAGWLGWAPESFGSTPIPLILLALDGVYERQTLLNPAFELRDTADGDAITQRAPGGKIDRDHIARSLADGIRSMAANQREKRQTERASE